MPLRWAPIRAVHDLLRKYFPREMCKEVGKAKQGR
jgi:hypothetical protein